MPLLGIGKKKEAEEKEEVPDELPDLPEGEAPPGDAVSGSQDETAPAELPEAGAELAPDELPPITADGVGGDVGTALETADANLADRRLYFSQVLQKFHEEGLKSTKLVSPSADLLSDMKRFWRDKKKSDKIEAMRQKITADIAPLQKLEKEWVELREDIEQKKKLLRDKETAIRSLGEELKTLARKTDKAGGTKKK